MSSLISVIPKPKEIIVTSSAKVDKIGLSAEKGGLI
jgi:hypothetical protein